MRFTSYETHHIAARVERALVLLACFIELDGDVHVPLYERLEAELEQITRREDAKARARRRLFQCGQADPMKAISAEKPCDEGLHNDQKG